MNDDTIISERIYISPFGFLTKVYFSTHLYRTLRQNNHKQQKSSVAKHRAFLLPQRVNSKLVFTLLTEELLNVEKVGWGNEGSNGGQVNFAASEQKLEGVITVDEIARANIVLNNKTNFTGLIKSDGESF